MEPSDTSNASDLPTTDGLTPSDDTLSAAGSVEEPQDTELSVSSAPAEDSTAASQDDAATMEATHEAAPEAPAEASAAPAGNPVEGLIHNTIGALEEMAQAVQSAMER